MDFIKSEIERITEEIKSRNQQLKILNTQTLSEKHDYGVLKEQFRQLRTRYEQKLEETASKNKQITQLNETLRQQQLEGQQIIDNVRIGQSNNFMQMGLADGIGLVIKEIQNLQNDIKEEQAETQAKIQKFNQKYININFQGRQCSFRNTDPNYDIQQLQFDICEYFDVDSEKCVLKDQNEALWPLDVNHQFQLLDQCLDGNYDQSLGLISSKIQAS